METGGLIRLPRFGVVASAVALSGVVLAGCAGLGPAEEGFPHVVGFVGCKEEPERVSEDSSPGTVACVEYFYDGVSVLRLRHVSTAFNCAPEGVGGHVWTLPGGVIRVTEDEHAPNPADCLCLYDVEYRIPGIPPGRYRITVEEMYAGEGNEQFDFAVDLTQATSGEECLPRAGYPWE